MLPIELPRTVADFDRFCDQVFETYGLPTNPSYRHAMAGIIMHLGPLQEKAPGYLFAKSIKKAMANHAAYEKIQQLKEEEKKYHEDVKSRSNGVKTVQDVASEVVPEA